MKAPLVTVYITNRNYGKYLRESIKSVLDQTLQDFELLIIDDGSVDESKEILKDYEDLQDVFVIYQQNKGLNSTANVALKLARGKYIIRLDADDYFDKNALEVMTSYLEKDKKLSLIFPDYYLVDESGNILSHMQRHNFDNTLSLKDRPAHGACTLIRRKILSSLGGYDESFSMQDGYDLWLGIIKDHLVTNVNLPLFYYRQHEKSLSKNEENLLKTRFNEYQTF
ncbi:MAG: glycosyltransferase [Candidatus Marinimicrobia bacterium]|nr:glycosyltransferase [Candidatus Neomarinimicrobiota bacterium]